MKRMVLGFAFNPFANKVLLIHKNRPDWQRGKLNGVGGHIEGSETSRDAMVREFREETGEIVPDFMWTHAGRMEHLPTMPGDEPWSVTVYCTSGNNWPSLDMNKTDEPLEWVPVASLTELAAAGGCIENIPVLVALCLLQPAPPSNRRPDFLLRY